MSQTFEKIYSPGSVTLLVETHPVLAIWRRGTPRLWSSFWNDDERNITNTSKTKYHLRQQKEAQDKVMGGSFASVSCNNLTSMNAETFLMVKMMLHNVNF